MPIRYTPLANGEYYHIFNRGITRQPIFLDKRDYQRFIDTLYYYRFLSLSVKLSRFLTMPEEDKQNIMINLENTAQRQVEIVCYVFMPNHFHLLLKQTSDKGISNYMRLILNSWTKFFNNKHNRKGSLFQGVFKAVRVETDEQLIHLSRYIHLNPLVSYVVNEKDFLSYPWSSLPDFLKGKSSLVDVSLILTHFPSPTSYQKYVLDQADYAKELESIKHLALEI